MNTTLNLALHHTARACAAVLLTTACIGSAMAQTASTGITRGAVAVTTSMGNIISDLAPRKTIDQSGLSLPYVGGATLFDSYVTTVTHSLAGYDYWVSSYGKTTGTLTFDLGAAFAIDGMALFGVDSIGHGNIKGLKVYADNDANPANGNAGLLFDSGGLTVAAMNTVNVITFGSATTTRYITFDIAGSTASPTVGLGEVIFRESLPVAAVPEPGTYALFGLGLLAVAGVAQRRRLAQR